MSDIFEIQSSALPAEAHVIGFEGDEALCRPYRYDVRVTVPDLSAVDLADVVGVRATLSIHHTADADPLFVNGVIASARLVHTWGAGALLRVVIAPELWLLSLGRQSRLFTNKALPDILSAVLEDGGLSSQDYDLRLQASYAVEEHVCQYQESSLDFLHRWMEREGIYYFFEQSDAREKLVITDSPATHVELVPRPVRYLASGHSGRASRAIDGFASHERSMPSAVRLADYDYTKPNLEVTGKASVSSVGEGEIWHHSARVFTPSDASRMAKLRSQEILATQSVCHATGTTWQLRTGYQFELEDHPVARLNKKYLVTAARHVGTRPTAPELADLPTGPDVDLYRVEVAALDAAVQFRPRQSTPWPRIHGFEGAVVDGAATSDYAQIDDHGRYCIKFRFDESDLKDGKASTWVRMLQPHGGGVEGFHFPLRKGTEVLVSFVNGDPDRPLIAGVAPNAQKPSPVTSKNHTTNIIQTGGRNRVEMEDLDGTQRMTWSTPTETTMLRMGAPNDDRNAHLTTAGVGTVHEGADFTILVHGNKREEAQATIDEIYTKDFKTTVDLDTIETYKAHKKETVGGAAKQTYSTSQKTTVTYNVDETFQDEHSTTVEEDTSLKVGLAVLEVYGGKLDTGVKNKVTDTYSTGYTLEVGKPMTHEVKAGTTRSCASFSDTILYHHETKRAEAIELGLGITSDTVGGAWAETDVGGAFEAILAVDFSMSLAIFIEKVAVKGEINATKVANAPLAAATGTSSSSNTAAAGSATAAISAVKAGVNNDP